MKVQVQIKNVYGNELIYPICEKAKLLCKLAGAKTFTNEAYHTAKQLGYEFELVFPHALGAFR